MNVRLLGLFLSAPWLIKLVMVNLETGEEGEAPQEVWDRTAEALRLPYSQVRLPYHY